ncbi:MAG TPA: alcohol dehydrogenase catalytic domain-containing protein [Mycobacteriales bacterium]|jgi:2-desacetyl-2-hydroxyethyl bacteriochlorophyllide A dehydrogenase|nr:alcohol dehydrogenase catalytic domain-containing protein [Mycobacteriales bacterium]
MPDTMQAVVCHGPEDYRLERRDVPQPGPGEALLQIEAVGICASDLKCYHGAPMFWGDETRPAYCESPVVPGHEFTGKVVALDAAARERWGVDVGDRVVSEQIVPCNECRYCERGQYWLCQQHNIYGFKKATHGAMAEFLLVPAQARVHRISADLPAAHAAFAEPLSCALHAVERATIGIEDVVVVAGAGPIGLGMIAGARQRGPKLVVSLDFDAKRRDLAKACGADLALNPGDTDVIEEVRKLTGGYGCDVYLEATGHPAAVPQGLQMLRKAGTFVEYSVMREPVTVDWTIIGDTKELDVRGAHLGPYCWPAAIRMIENNVLPVERIVTHQLPVAQFAEGLDLVGDGTRSVKVALVP